MTKTAQEISPFKVPISDGCEMNVAGIAPNMPALGMAGRCSLAHRRPGVADTDASNGQLRPCSAVGWPQACTCTDPTVDPDGSVQNSDDASITPAANVRTNFVGL